MSGDTDLVISDCATGTENWTSGQCWSKLVGNKASALDTGFLDGVGWSMAQKAIESVELAMILIDCCSKAQMSQQGGLELLKQ